MGHSRLATMPRLPVELIKVHPDAHMPQYQTPGAAGADFFAYCPEGPVVIAPGQSARISAGVKAFIGTPAWALVLMPRSGLGSKGIILANSIGLIDSDYQGEIGMMLYNRSNMPFTVSTGDRVAQGAFMAVEQAVFIEVEQFSQATARGEGGFGSTGGSALTPGA